MTVNDAKLSEPQYHHGATAGAAIPVPLKSLKIGGANRIRFEMEGRGRFGYAVTLQGFTRDFTADQKPANRVARISRRVYHPAQPRARRPSCWRPASTWPSILETFENVATQVGLGAKGAHRAQCAPQRPRQHARMGA